MKFCLVFLAVLGLSCGASIKGRKNVGSLVDDLKDFLKLIPTDQIANIALDHLSNDPEVQELMEYIQSDEFRGLAQTVEGLPEVVELLHYINDAGIPIYDIINQINEIIGIPDIHPRAHQRRARSVRSMLDEIEAILPFDKLQALFDEKMKTSVEFKALYDKLASDEVHKTVDNVLAMPEVQDLIAKLKGYGLDIDMVIDLIKKILGWDTVTRNVSSLVDDLKDFLKLIPTDQIANIALDHLSNDPEVQELMEYIQSDEFRGLAQTVEGLPEVVEMLHYINDAGIPIYDIINKINEIIGIPDIHPRAHTRRTRSVRSMVDEIEAIIPFDKLQALFDEKMKTSAEFKALYDKLASDEVHKAVDNALAMPEVQDLFSKLKGYGLDIDMVIDLIKKILGWN